jgi:hypothetical protein
MAGGRPPGAINKRTSQAMELFGPHVADAIKTLRQIAANIVAHNSDRIAAGKIICEYGLGKPVQPTEVGGPDGAPIQHEVIVTWRAPEGKQ